MSEDLNTGYMPAGAPGPLDGQAANAHAGTELDSEALERIVADAGTTREFELYVQRPKPPLLVVLTGPSGVGKDVTLERMREMGVKFHYVVTVTTRKQRPGEINGVHYHFVTREEYNRMLADGELLEHSEVFDNSYGIPKNEVIPYLQRGDDVIMKPDVQGAEKIRKLEPEAVFIFLAPPSMEEQERRLIRRKTEDPQELERRLSTARQEMQQLTHFEYVVVNHSNKLDETVRTIEAIMQAEKSRVHPRTLRLAEAEYGQKAEGGRQ